MGTLNRYRLIEREGGRKGRERERWGRKGREGREGGGGEGRGGGDRGREVGTLYSVILLSF